MKTSVAIRTTFDCSLERAVKCPILCDIAKVHTGFGVMPRIMHCTDDQNWGKPGSTKRVWAARSLTFAGGEISLDRVVERIENTYWKIEVSEFKSWMLGFTRFEGEWRTTELKPNKILIKYTYTLHSNSPWLYPVNWLFTKLFWRSYMKRVLENVRVLAYGREPYQYD